MRGSLTVFGLLALGPSCVPSHRLVHDGNRYFEHCYGADFDPDVTAAQKEACWQAWIAHYTRHQPAQRVDYAMRRVEAVQNGEPPLWLPGRSEPGSAPAPSVEQLASLTRGGTSTSSSVAAEGDGGASEVPNGCLEACSAYEGRCISSCPDESANCRVGCGRERVICLGGCH